MKALQVHAMLKLQADMNAKVNPAWATAGNKWTRAIMVEGVEALGHLGWKWWKKETPDVAQYQIELVDIWHFGLSHLLTKTSHEEAGAAILHAVEHPQRYVMFDGAEYDLEDMPLRDTLDLLIGMAGAGSFSLHVFRVLLEDAGMSWDDLYKSYIAKNVLNFFRQDNGYKAGTYIKNWFHEEDNVYLAKIMATLDAGDPAFQRDLYNRLVDAYHAVLTANGRLAEACALVSTKK